MLAGERRQHSGCEMKLPLGFLFRGLVAQGSQKFFDFLREVFEGNRKRFPSAVDLIRQPGPLYLQLKIFIYHADDEKRS